MGRERERELRWAERELRRATERELRREKESKKVKEEQLGKNNGEGRQKERE